MRFALSQCERVDTVTFKGKCIFSGKPHSVTVPRAELDAYMAGELIQDALKSVSADDREFLISGISPGEFPLPEEHGGEG